MPRFRDQPTFTQTYEATLWLPREADPLWALSIPRRSLSESFQRPDDFSAEYDVLSELLGGQSYVFRERERARVIGAPPEKPVYRLVMDALTASGSHGRALADQAWVPLERSPVSGSSITNLVGAASVVGVAVIGGHPVVLLVGVFGWVVLKGVHGVGTGLDEALRAAVRHKLLVALDIPEEARSERLREFPRDDDEGAGDEESAIDDEGAGDEEGAEEGE